MMRNVDIYFLWVFSLLRKSLIYLDNLDWLPDTSHWKTLKIYSFFRIEMVKFEWTQVTDYMWRIFWLLKISFTVFSQYYLDIALI